MTLGYCIPITPREMPFKLDVLETQERSRFADFWRIRSDKRQSRKTA